MPGIKSFVHYLSTLEQILPERSENMYFGSSSDSRIRRHNLTIYLEKMQALNPKILLLGEAPGYKGCQLTGIPFSSEKIIKTHPFFANQNFKLTHPGDKLESEQSATIVWKALENYENKPLIWNIFPFHPHEKGNAKTNRSPVKAELEQGKQILEELLLLFNIQKIGTVGRKAESQLLDFPVPCSYIRHPANGGKTKFIYGLKELMA